MARKLAPATVITEKRAENPPTLSVAEATASGVAEEITRTQTLWPAAMVDAFAVKVPSHPIEYSPPATLIGAGALMPVIVTVFEVSVAPGVTAPRGTKTKASGCVSQATVETLKNRLGIPAIESVVSVVVPRPLLSRN